jgi:hypothetical protein
VKCAAQRAVELFAVTMIDEVLARLDSRNRAVAVELAWLPEHIRGSGT